MRQKSAKGCLAKAQASTDWFKYPAAVVLGMLVSGCTTTVPTPENSALTNLFNSVRGESLDPTASTPLSPAIWYLKVQVPDTPPALLVFGYLEPHTTPPTEVWFSGGGQFIKIREGRVVATYGLAVNWQDVSAKPGWPQWSDVAHHGKSYTRIRSALPSYDAGISELMHLSPLALPAVPVSGLMPGASDIKATQWRWYKEEVISSPRSKIPTALFATANVEGTTVVAFSQQCLSERYCLHIMRWPQLESTPQP